MGNNEELPALVEYREMAKLLVNGEEMYRQPMVGALPEERGTMAPVIETGLALAGLIMVPPTEQRGPTIVSLQSGKMTVAALLVPLKRRSNNNKINKRIMMTELCDQR